MILRYNLYMQKQEGDITFYGTKGPYGFLSNFYAAPFKIGPHLYPTNEHFFQSQKFVGIPTELELIAAPNPKSAKMMGKKFKMQRPEDWAQKKQGVMLEGLRAKFRQNQTLREELLKTEGRVLREHTARDKYWGDGGKKFTGKNRLGVLLMQVRAEIRDQV